ncbi:hypothetical protein NUW58_g4585 [Xylaria curta]|uniref:Uncharacterized protein n=1 Tax=Xylaria curta TaxID=42375 RepID=A0ACC1P712_9PEZI|nr:hypothetical protein NUW58_g4585 [Xylaria curta]
MALPLGAVQILAVSLTAFALSAIALALRLWARAIKKKPLSPSDYMVIFAMVNSMAKIALFFAVVFNGGVGVHLGELLSTNPAAFSLFVKLFVPAQLLWAAANTCNKISILLLYTELFPVTKLIILCRICIAVSAAYFLSVFLEAFLLCTPAAYNWDKSIPDGVCRNQDLADLLSGITNLIIDAIVVILPMPQLFVLQMSLAKRISIAAMFSLGAL